MKGNYPLLSKELNDRLQLSYEKLLYLLGNNDDNGDRIYDGHYDTIINNEDGFYGQIPKYITMPNSVNPGNGSITLYLDKMSYKLRLRRL